MATDGRLIASQFGATSEKSTPLLTMMQTFLNPLCVNNLLTSRQRIITATAGKQLQNKTVGTDPKFDIMLNL